MGLFRVYDNWRGTCNVAGVFGASDGFWRMVFAAFVSIVIVSWSQSNINLCFFFYLFCLFHMTMRFQFPSALLNQLWVVGWLIVDGLPLQVNYRIGSAYKSFSLNVHLLSFSLWMDPLYELAGVSSLSVPLCCGPTDLPNGEGIPFPLCGAPGLCGVPVFPWCPLYKPAGYSPSLPLCYPPVGFPVIPILQWYFRFSHFRWYWSFWWYHFLQWYQFLWGSVIGFW